VLLALEYLFFLSVFGYYYIIIIIMNCERVLWCVGAPAEGDAARAEEDSQAPARASADAG
jgi:hypothetical protein